MTKAREYLREASKRLLVDRCRDAWEMHSIAPMRSPHRTLDQAKERPMVHMVEALADSAEKSQAWLNMVAATIRFLDSHENFGRLRTLPLVYMCYGMAFSVGFDITDFKGRV